LFLKVGKDGFGETDRGEEVHLEETGPVFGRRKRAGCAGAGAEVRDEVVDVAEVGDGAIEGLLYGGGLGEVAGDGEDFVG